LALKRRKSSHFSLPFVGMQTKEAGIFETSQATIFHNFAGGLVYTPEPFLKSGITLFQK